MKTKDEMYEMCKAYGIAVYKFNLHNNASISMPTLDGCAIAIDYRRLGSNAKEVVCLAHEMGHCMTCSFYQADNPLDVRGKHEYRADKWAAKERVPLRKLKRVLKNGITQPWELAEEFEVTEDFISRAFYIYRNEIATLNLGQAQQ